jgi:hypothetical protein
MLVCSFTLDLNFRKKGYLTVRVTEGNFPITFRNAILAIFEQRLLVMCSIKLCKLLALVESSSK